MTLNPANIGRCATIALRGVGRLVGPFLRGAILAGIGVVVVTAAQVSLAWDDNSTDEIGFKVERSVSGGVFTQIAVVGADTAFYVDATLVDGTAYAYRVRAYNAAGDSGYSNIASTDAAGVASASRFGNLSIRALAGTGSNMLIVGFVVPGGSNKSVLVRGVGPTLTSFEVTTPLDDPILSIFSDVRLIDSNDDWGTMGNAAQLAAAGSAVGAFALPAGSRDSVLLPSLASGPHTVQLSGKAGSTGVALIELYDADARNVARLVNISARTRVGVDVEAPIVGFVITGNFPKPVLIRAIGPGLAGFEVTGVLVDPQLLLYRQGGSTPIRQNDNWGGTASLRSVFRATGAFALEDASRDAAISITLEPGAYTAQISGVNASTGVALIEIYEVP